MAILDGLRPIPAPTDRHCEIRGGLLRGSGLTCTHVPDARPAALATEHGLVLHSTDGDFARFQGLRRVNPPGRSQPG